MTEARDGDSRWAWDTAPTDGSHPGPVYIGDMEDWSHEETMKRRDTFRDPWGGVWTEPLTPGATKAKWGTRNFKTGRYRCCEDLDDCGVVVSVSQGPNKAWCFQRQWSYGKNNSSAHNQDSCRNKSNYTGTTRFHNIVVNEIYGMLRNSKVLGGKRIESTKKERTVTGLGMFEPDVYVEFEDESWFAIEVILTSAPDREKHDKFGTNLIEINLNELECLDNDREFSRWIQQGGVSELLLAEATLEQRTHRWNERKKGFDVDDEKAFRRNVRKQISKCQNKFGFPLDIDVESITNIEEVTRAFEAALSEKKAEKRKAEKRKAEAEKRKAEFEDSVREWQEVRYPQAIAKLEEEFELTEEEVGLDSTFPLDHLRDAFEAALSEKKAEKRKAEKRKAEKRKAEAEAEKREAEAEKRREEFEKSLQDRIEQGESWSLPEDQIQFYKIMKEIQQKHGKQFTLDWYPGWTENHLWSFFDLRAELPKLRRKQKKAYIQSKRILDEEQRKFKEAERRYRLAERNKRDEVTYFNLKSSLKKAANDERNRPEFRQSQQAALDRLIENEGKKWGDPDAS